MGGDEGRNSRSIEEVQRSENESFGKNIKYLYDLGLQLGLKYSDLYFLDYEELQNTIIQYRMGVAKNIWKLASLTRHPYVKNFPESPEEAFPDFFPPKKTYKMPDYLKEKWLMRGGK